MLSRQDVAAATLTLDIFNALVKRQRIYCNDMAPAPGPPASLTAAYISSLLEAGRQSTVPVAGTQYANPLRYAPTHREMLPLH